MEKIVPRRILPADWVLILAQVQKSLSQAIGHADAQEKQLESIAAAPTFVGEERPSWQDGLKRLDQDVSRFNISCLEAQQNAANHDDALATIEEAMKEWLAAAASMQLKLANWSAFTV